MSNMWDRFTRWRSSSEYEQKFVLEINLEENYQRIIPIWVKKPTLYTKISDICRRIALKLKQFLAATVFLLYGYCQQFYYEISYLGCYQYFCLQRQRFRRWRSSTKHEELIPLLRMDGTYRWICPGCLREPTRFEKILGIFRRASVKIKSMITKLLVNCKNEVMRLPISVISYVSMALAKNPQAETVQVPSNEASTENDHELPLPEDLQFLSSEEISDNFRRASEKMKQFLAATVSFLYGCCQPVYLQTQQFCYEIAQFCHEISFYGCYQYFCLQSQQYCFKIYQFNVQLTDDIKYGLRKVKPMITKLLVNCKNEVMRLPISVISYVSMPLKMVNQMCSLKLKAKNPQAKTVQVPSNEASTETDNAPDQTKDLLNFLSSENERFESLLKSQLKIFECPVCFEVMKSPRRIFGCSNDHFICSECLKSSCIKCCPICREDYETNKPQRRFKSEDLLALISSPSEKPESSKVEIGKGKSRRKRIRRKKTTEDVSVTGE